MLNQQTIDNKTTSYNQTEMSELRRHKCRFENES